MFGGVNVRLGHVFGHTQNQLKIFLFSSKLDLRHVFTEVPSTILLKDNKHPLTNGRVNFFTLPGIASKKKEYVGKKVVGFTPEQMYNVVADVESYTKFVPFCIKSTVTHKSPRLLKGDLQVGFPPIIESYTSHVTLDRPNGVRAVCKDGKIFNHLTTTWKFDPGLKEQPQSCRIHFYLSFEFKSMIYSQLANVFFDELVKQMEEAFVKEAERRYGRPSLTTIKLR